MASIASQTDPATEEQLTMMKQQSEKWKDYEDPNFFKQDSEATPTLNKKLGSINEDYERNEDQMGDEDEQLYQVYHHGDQDATDIRLHHQGEQVNVNI